MSATEVAAPQPGSSEARPEFVDDQNIAIDDTPSSPLSELDDEVERDLKNGFASTGNGNAKETTSDVKIEDDDSAKQITAAANAAATTTTLQPDPAPSVKRRESEVAILPPEESERPNSKKRKRGSSPPWQFPTAENTTLKTADGRRISARFNSSTPALSDNDGIARARSSSLSVPPKSGLSNDSTKSRAASPPWKKFQAEGPTSMVVDGKRKSGRVNKDLSDPPKRVSPRSKKVDDKTAVKPVAGQRPNSAGKAVNGQAERRLQHSVPSQSKAVKESSSRPSSSSNSTDPQSKIAELRAQIEALKPRRSFPSPERPKQIHRRKRSSDALPAQTDGPPFRSPPHRKHSRPSNASLSPDAVRPSPKIKLRFTTPRRIIAPPHPNAKLPSPTFPPQPSIFQKIEAHELKEAQAPYTENERGPPDMAWFLQRSTRLAAEEGAMRKRLLSEAQPGGKLSKEHLSIYQDADPQPEPPKQYGHADHLVAHALHLRHLQQREKTAHRQLAKKVAHEALEFWRLKRGPTEEDLREEADKIFRMIYKQCVADVRAKWEMVGNHVQALRVERWKVEEERKRQERLREKLEWSENMVARQRGEGMDGDEDLEDDDDDEGDDGSGSSEEENMSESSSEASKEEDEEEVGELGDEELKAYLAQREVEPPDKREDEDGEGMEAEEEEEEDVEENDEEDVSLAEALHSEAGEDEEQIEQADVSMADLFAEGADDEDVDDEFELKDEDTPAEESTAEDHAVTDTEQSVRRSRRSSMSPANEQTDADNEEVFSSDQSTNMDSTDYDSDQDMSSTDEEDNGVEGEEEEGEEAGSGDEQPIPKNSLLSLFKDEVGTKFPGLPTPTTSAEGDEREAGVEEAPSSDAQADAGAAEEASSHRPEDSENLAQDLGDAQAPISVPASPSADSLGDTKQLVPSPNLLRGTLRSYQHAGLDWLASLYRQGTNGILADEMGLGKTIQTIALLAHLAEEHEIWDSHLVIVPTSVILNWVTEFQKFLPGFRVLGYYGTAEERQAKRRGWVNDPHHEIKEKRGYNVVVTSYNVAMQDINAIRNVQWHYLVLDEAHNIRNFNSQRWQVLIRLKTRARLLLTGTPLQNSLTELWSLLTFLTAGDDDPAHGDLEEFLSHWKEPVKEIFDRGVATLSHEAQKVVDQLHISLRPFLLRRLKSEVEKDLPKKTESVVVCKLSKRQRQLYQEYMGLAETRRSLTKGNAVSAGKVLLSLRRVCNHPDLFDPRPIQTSWAMERGVGEGFAGVEGMVRRLLTARGEDAKANEVPGFLGFVGNEDRKRYPSRRAKQLSAAVKIRKELEVQERDLKTETDAAPDASTIAGSRALLRLTQRQQKLEQLRSGIKTSEDNLQAAPLYGSDLRELLTLRTGKAYRVTARDMRGRVLARPLRGWPALGRYPLRFEMDHLSDWMLSQTSMLQQSVQTAGMYAERLHETITRFAFCTPAVTAPLLDCAIPERTQQVLRASNAYPIEYDDAHEARTRTAIAFPDSRLLIYDSGKLQRLTRLLRELQSKGSRSLIFTQMTGTLNILEQFLSLLNLPYLRMDGSTPVERRQLYSAEFNRPDSKYQCMILSSRAGGIGLNLIGASSVIFYDLDWNPQMDRQCMDRAHRIGQVRDVEVFKMVSEKTVEENILRRAEQKSLLDRTVIQEGHFTTEYQSTKQPEQQEEEEEGEKDDVAAAIERFLGGSNEKATTQALESVEEKEDVQAAQAARKEEFHQDDADFADRSSKGPSGPPTPGRLAGDGDDEEDGDDGDDGRKGHVDSYMVRLMEGWLKDVPFVPPQLSRKTDRHGRDPGHRAKRKR